ncbi:MAG: preprotein translocase subunit YajC, partial [Rhodospirillaceae bacterium]|nr:preprotein translocase subunit YajC [Rhodospirillaceae bacterium]
MIAGAPIPVRRRFLKKQSSIGDAEMWISQAFAQDAATKAADGGLLGQMGGILPLVLIFVVFWFLLIRPQQKR